MKTKVVVSKVAGVTYESRQDTIKRMTGREPARIVPEPENPYDPNALAVHVALDDGTVAHVGFIPRDLAAMIAPHLKGEAVMCRLLGVTGGFETWDGEIASLGLRIEVEYPIEDEQPYRETPDDYDLPVGDTSGR